MNNQHNQKQSSLANEGGQGISSSTASIKTLYLCEKPPQARVLAKTLGASRFENGAFYSDDGIAVTYGFGHMRELESPDAYLGHAEWRKEDLPIFPSEWLWKVSDSRLEQFANIGRCLAKSESVVIATDPDEEGEVIGRDILEAHGYIKPVMRLWASALNSDSLSAALANLLPLSATEAYYRAGKTRRFLDWLIGYNLTRYYSIEMGKTANIGRVKTRILEVLADRESKIASFVPMPTVSVSASINGLQFTATGGLSNLPDEEQGVCVSSKTEEVLLPPPLPFTLSGLLIQANEMAGISLSAGYAAAQTLYLAGAISYPRTSSTILPTNGGSGFAAHSAIMAMRNDCPAWADDTMRSIFEMVRLSGVYQDLGPAKISRTTTVFKFGHTELTNVTEIGNENEAGWLLCEQNRLSELITAKHVAFKVGSKVVAKLSASNLLTEAPARFGEGALLKMMVDNGIGTEATRVDAIAHLQHDKVAELVNGKFHVSKTGDNLVRQLPPGLGDEMNALVQDATERARKNGALNNGELLLKTVKWLTRTIRGVKQEELADVF